MANPNRRTVTQLLLDLRTNLDEATAAYWSDTRLTAFLNQAQHLVWLEVKRLKADYFDVERKSTDGSVTILGESYATSSFALVASTTRYTLPPDLAEMKLIECITSGYEQVRFDFRDLTSPGFRGLRSWTETQEPSAFLVDITGELTMVIAPSPNRALDLKINYVPILDNLTTGTDTLQMPHPLWLAVLDVATMRAQMMDSAPTFAIWQAAAATTVARFIGAHARQTQDAEYVIGTFEG
jgi:hypothetical protein